MTKYHIEFDLDTELDEEEIEEKIDSVFPRFFMLDIQEMEDD